MSFKKTTELMALLRGCVRKLSLEWLFLVLFLAFGVTFAVLIPPGWNTDETNHAYRIAQLAHGDLFSEKVVDPQTGIKAYGGAVPAVLIDLFNQTGVTKPGGIGNPINKIDPRLYHKQPAILTERDTGKRQVINFSGAALYSPVTYIIYLPVFWLGSLCSLPVFWIVMACRLVGLLLTGLSFFLAIKYVPVGKWIFFAVGLLPSVIIQAQSVGADAPELAASVLFVTVLLRLVYMPRKLVGKDYSIFVILGTLLAFIKLVYAPMVLLLLALPLLQKMHRTRKTVLLLLTVIVISVIPSLVWSHLVAYIDINSNPQADFAAQKLFIMHQPLTYLRTLYYTFFTNQQTALDNLFGSLVSLPAVYAYMAPAVLVLSLLVRSDREAKVRALSRLESKLWRTTLLVVSVLTMILIATALYVYSTTLRQSSIISIQSRYFLPLLPLLLLAFYGNTLKNQRKPKIALVCMSAFVLVGAALALYDRLYAVVPLILG